MKKINDYVDKINDEIDGAKCYAEMYVYEKAAGNQKKAQTYHAMAGDELKHATLIHDIAVEEIEQLRKIYTPPQEMEETWNRSHIAYVDRVSWIKNMLTM